MKLPFKVCQCDMENPVDTAQIDIQANAFLSDDIQKFLFYKTCIKLNKYDNGNETFSFRAHIIPENAPDFTKQVGTSISLFIDAT